MKQIFLSLLLFPLGTVAGLLCADRCLISSCSASQPAILMIDRLRQLAELTTLVVDVADIQQTNIEGRVGGISAVLLIKGEVRISIDLRRARFESVDDVKKTAVLILEPPAVSTATLDHDRTRLFAVTEQGLWLITPGNKAYNQVVTRAFIQAQHAIAHAGNSPELLNQARRRTETVLQGLLGAVGWQLNIHWSDATSSRSSLL